MSQKVSVFLALIAMVWSPSLVRADLRPPVEVKMSSATPPETEWPNVSLDGERRDRLIENQEVGCARHRARANA